MFMVITPNVISLSVVLDGGELFAKYCINIKTRKLEFVISYLRTIFPGCTIVANTSGETCLRCKLLYVHLIDNIKRADNIRKFICSDNFKK